MTDDDRSTTVHEFKSAVNMTATALQHWLDSADSQSVGMTPGGEKVTQSGGEEAVGHHMGRQIVDLLHKKAADLTEDDIKTMRKVVGYVHRHSKQQPEGDVTDTRWRKSLMNWGHDPLQ